MITNANVEKIRSWPKDSDGWYVDPETDTHSEEGEEVSEKFSTPADLSLHKRKMKARALALSIAIYNYNRPGLHPDYRHGLEVANVMLCAHFQLDKKERKK